MRPGIMNIQFLIFAFLLLLPAGNLHADQQTLRLTLPAPVLLSVLQGLQPIPIILEQDSMSGDLAIQSIDRLQMHDNSIMLHGMLQGENLAMNTTIAGRTLKLKLGNLRLPITCDLKLRLDKKAQAIFIRPSLKMNENKTNKNDPLSGLLQGLGGNREYKLTLDELDRLVSKGMGRTVSLGLRPVELKLSGNTLILGLRTKK